MSKNMVAVTALIEAELGEYGHHHTIIDDDGDFEVDFPAVEGFNTIYIQVVKLDEQDPEASRFKVQVHDDSYESFVYFDHTVKELWKALLWK